MGRVRTRIDPDIFRLMLTEGIETRVRCSHGLPVTAEFVTMTRDPQTHDFILFWEDDAFETVPSGSLIPEVDLRWKSL